jgi:hypothetical protein
VYSNRLNLPAPLVRAAEKAREGYSKGAAKYSVTELIGPPREAALMRVYGQFITEDIADVLTAMYGSLIHKIIELGGPGPEGAVLEERIFAEVDGILISGAMDHTLFYPDGAIEDWKFTATYSVLGKVKAEWEAQLNLYKFLRETQGHIITKLRIVALLRDWSIAQARQAGHAWEYTYRDDNTIDVFRSPDPEQPNEEAERRYPAQGQKTLDVPVWDPVHTFDYLRTRIQLHLEADKWAEAEADKWTEALSTKQRYEGLEPYCSDEERWTRPVKWAHMKHSRKTAVHLYQTEEEAHFAANAAPGSYVEMRGGERTRCLDWCVPGRAGLCTQWNADRPTGKVTPTMENVYE